MEVAEVIPNFLYNQTKLDFTARIGGGAGGKKIVVEPHRHPGLYKDIRILSYLEIQFDYFLGVFIARSKDDDMLLTRNMVVGESVYGEKRVSVDVSRRQKISLSKGNEN